MRALFVILFIICFGFNLSHELIAQTKKYSFQQLTEEHGLSQNFAYGLTQDDRGFLWVGTGAGLSRYDGYEVKKFNIKDSLSADFITADFRTASGNLLFGHIQGGLTLFDGIVFRPILPDTLGSKVVGITEDSQNNFWVATQSKGFVFIDKTFDSVSAVFPHPLQGQIINATFSRRGVLWVGTDEGIFFFRIDGNSLTLIEQEILPPYVGVNSILPHDVDTTLCFVGTAFRGIYLLKHGNQDRIIVQHRIELPEVSRDIIQTMAQDPDGDLWVGTRQSGVMHLNISRDRKTIFKIDYFRKEFGFPFSSANKLIVDRQGQVWISTMGDGLIKIHKEFFTYFPFAMPYGVGEVRGIAETPSGYLVATDRGILQISLNKQSDEYKVELLNTLRGESVLSVYTDSRRNVWVATETKGVYMLASGDHSMRPVSIDPENHPLEIRLFEEDNKGNIWMAARAQGVYVLDKQQKGVKHFTTANRFIHNDIFAIKADTHGNIWFGTHSDGLARFDKNGVLELFSQQEKLLRARDINDIDEDDQGNIWIATEGEGFFKYSDGKFTQIGSAENLVSPFIKGIQFDPTGRIWFSYRKGLGYFDLQSEKKYHFTREDGLLANEAYSSSIIVDSKFNKWFCNDYGVTLFEHDTIAESRRLLETYLTGIRIFFKDYPATLRSDEQSGGSMIGALPPLELTHEENHITFDYVAIKLNGSGKIYYRHLLDGYDSDWTPAKTANFVTYTNLDPGKYVLKVQATDDLGAWVDPITEYSFEITPPYWKRTWFYLLQILSVVTLFTLTYLIGKRGIARKRFVLRLMLFSSFFITLEYVENFIDPLVSGFLGGAPVFRFFLNFLLALLLLPVETLITRWLTDDERKLKASVLSKTIDLPEAILEEDKIESAKELPN